MSAILTGERHLQASATFTPFCHLCSRATDRTLVGSCQALCLVASDVNFSLVFTNPDARGMPKLLSFRGDLVMSCNRAGDGWSVGTGVLL